jgi:hypothetical protein
VAGVSHYRPGIVAGFLHQANSERVSKTVTGTTVGLTIVNVFRARAFVRWIKQDVEGYKDRIEKQSPQS